MSTLGIGTGIGSGMDIKGMVEALVNAEAAPKSAQLNRLEKATTAKFSGVSQFLNTLSEFQTIVKDLNSAALFEKRSATSSKTDLFTVSADSKAVSGNYSVQVMNLAQTSKVALKSVADPAASLGTGTLDISGGDETLAVSVTEGNDRLTGIRDAINAAGKESGLSATVVNDPNGGGARLVLSSTRSGTDNDISVTAATGSAAKLSDLNFQPPATENFIPVTESEDGPRVISYARDANFAIDGIALSSQSNTVENAIEGVTITLKSAQSEAELDAAESGSLTVGEDRSGVKSQLKKFVTAYNDMTKAIGSLTNVTAVGGDSGTPLAGPLVGDASVRSFMSAMRSVMGDVGSGEGVRILADLGVTTQRDGTLQIDDAKLDKTLDQNFDQVAGFITGEDGLMARLNGKIDPYTQTGGILESRTKALQNTLTGANGVDEQREQLTRRISKLETRLFAQFNAMDTLIGQLSGTSNYLTGVLDSLPGVVKQSK